MNQNNWQSYLDGSLDSDEMARLEYLLRTDSAAKRELDGLKAFRAEIRKKGLDVGDIPQRAMQARLSEFIKSERVSVPRKPWRFAALGALAFCCLTAVAIVAYVRRDPVHLDVSGETASYSHPSAERAQSWVAERVNVPVARIEFDSIAKMVAVRHGFDWGAYDYSSKNELYSIYFKRTVETFDDLPHTDRAGLSYFVGHGIGWRQEGTVYYVVGGNEPTRWRIAEAARKQVIEQTPTLPSGKSYNRPPEPTDHRSR